ncbi:MAG: quinol dehydrogenase ferredoxin subunit NapH [Candidatus Marithrix sp.]|nr:quinol dehydrogenase ferredoxin subunit NapH [Candidatus Marithrix sp.]
MNWFKTHKYLLLRRIVQLNILGLFMLGPWFGIWIIKGNLTASLILDTLPLTDPYVLLQSLVAGHIPELIALVGAGIILLFYIIIGGRVYCSWVCPINIVTDAAAYLRNKLAIKTGSKFSRSLRYWILGMTIIVSWLTATVVWEFVNPVSMLYRGVIFGMGLAYVTIIAIFVFDLFVSHRGWCSHLCPVGAFYSLLSKFSKLRIDASKREQCDDCMDCFKICPEPQVIKPALKQLDNKSIILASNCTNCGRCIDVCVKDVFNFSIK